MNYLIIKAGIALSRVIRKTGYALIWVHEKLVDALKRRIERL